MPSQPPTYEIAVRGLTKQFGRRRVVDDLSFTVRPGRVTGFLGPNGAGKTTTLRMLLGLITPSAGTALIGARAYPELAAPTRTVGALLEANGFHPDRSGRDHLRTYAAATGVPETRIDQVLDEVGLGQAARQHVRGYSLGMRQRLGIASALLPDPPVLICDEPTNGLDPEGIRWLRALLRERAERGHTVLVSSHLLAEMQQTVDSVVIVDHGRLIYEGPLEAAGGGAAVRVTCVDAPALHTALAAEAFGTGGASTGGSGSGTGRDTGTGTRGALIEPAGPGTLLVRDVTAEQVGRIALRAGIALTQLVTEADNLEQLFFSLTETATPAPTDLRTGGTHDAALSPTTKEMAQ